jgi:hypothetical protein
MRGLPAPADRPPRDDIAAAVAAYDQSNPLAPLPRNAARLLTAMFPTGDIYRGNLEDMAAIGFKSRRHLPGTLQRLINARFLSWEKGRPSTYWLHLPPQVRR